jgi:hypothetical protein
VPGPRLDLDLAAHAAEADGVARDELCCFWVAATDIAEGQEACLNYGYLTPDLVGRGGGMSRVSMQSPTGQTPCQQRRTRGRH